MERVVHTVLGRVVPKARRLFPPRILHPGRLTSKIRAWQLWSLASALRVFILAVIAADLAWIAVLAAGFRVSAHDLLLFAALLGCIAATVELTRRAGEPTGIVKDVYAVWELPMVILLPPLYALAIPWVRLALTQWRVRRAPLHRRAFTAAAIGLAYGCASLVFRAMIPAGVTPLNYLCHNTTMWLLAAACCALAQWGINLALVLIAVKGADPKASVREKVLGKEALYNDATELCAAIFVSLGVQVSALTLLVAFPMGTLLQRSFRHAQLLHEARADSKTGLLNAATWEREATAEVARAVRTSSPLAVALLDLDRFKLINDTYGHLVGDQVLRQIAETMTAVLRDYDRAGRFGGEEFAMVLPQTRAVDAFRIAERVRAHIAQLPIYATGASGTERVPVTVSIGVAALDTGSRRELPELLAAADAALYRAKASGRDQVQMISTSRGLSAVRPPAGDDGGAVTPSHGFGAVRPPAGSDGTGGGPSHGLGSVQAARLGGEAGDLFAPGGAQRLTLPRRAPGQPAQSVQLGVADGDAGSASTAITSALAV